MSEAQMYRKTTRAHVVRDERKAWKARKPA